MRFMISQFPVICEEKMLVIVVVVVVVVVVMFVVVVVVVEMMVVMVVVVEMMVMMVMVVVQVAYHLQQTATLQIGIKPTNARKIHKQTNTRARSAWRAGINLPRGLARRRCS